MIDPDHRERMERQRLATPEPRSTKLADLDAEVHLTAEQVAECIQRDFERRGLTVHGEVLFTVSAGSQPDGCHPGHAPGLTRATVKVRI